MLKRYIAGLTFLNPVHVSFGTSEYQPYNIDCEHRSRDPPETTASAILACELWRVPSVPSVISSCRMACWTVFKRLSLKIDVLRNSARSSRMAHDMPQLILWRKKSWGWVGNQKRRSPGLFKLQVRQVSSDKWEGIMDGLKRLTDRKPFKNQSATNWRAAFTRALGEGMNGSTHRRQYLWIMAREECQYH